MAAAGDGGIAVRSFESPEGALAIVFTPEDPGEKWMETVAEELAPLPAVFVRPEKKGQSVHAVSAPKARKVSAGELEAVRKAADGGALERLPEIDRAFTAEDLERRLEEENAAAIELVAQSLRSPMGVIPFLGAGTSHPFKYPLWGEFLVEAAKDADREAVKALIDQGEFEKAAERLVQADKDRFYDRVRECFTRPPDAAKLADSPVARLPLLAPGPIITTNFDRVIETELRRSVPGFKDTDLVIGRGDALRVMETLQQNRRALVKLHGDAGVSHSLTFTALEYQLSYGDQDRAGPLAQLAWVVYTNRPLLFIGCSLETDRTVRSLEKVKAQIPFVRHFAVLAASFVRGKLRSRAEKLAGAGITPLWFVPKDFKRIAEILDTLIERASLDELPRLASRPARTPGQSRTRPPAPDGGEWPDLTEDHWREVGEAAASGGVAFFLGAGVHPNPLLGGDFYRLLSERAGVPLATRDRADVAQHVLDAVGRTRLSEIVEGIVRDHVFEPSTIHRFLSDLSGGLRQSGKSDRSLMVLTTNYDSALEEAFDDAGEPYHLFIYDHAGRHAGRVLHRMPDGRQFVIRRPEAVRSLPDQATIIVKLNGGIDPHDQWPGTLVVASRDFEEISNRLPGLLPAVVWNRLKRRSLLFLGHGLREPDVRALARSHRLERAVDKSWAVQLHRRDTEYWAETRGVTLVEADLWHYLERLSKEVRARLEK